MRHSMRSISVLVSFTIGWRVDGKDYGSISWPGCEAEGSECTATGDNEKYSMIDLCLTPGEHVEGGNGI